MGSALRRRHGPSHQSSLWRGPPGQPRFRQTQSHWTCCLVLKGRAQHRSLFELNVRMWWSARERAVRDIERPGL
jgi:hypothetical protein